MQCHGSNVGAMGSLRSGNGNESGGVPFMLCSSDGINADPLTARDGPGNYSKAGNNPRSHHDHIVRTNNTTANGHGVATEAAHTLGADCASSQAANGVRRLTPRECERLQGLPDDWTRVPYRNKPANSCPDGPRYRAIGNGWALPVARWVFERVEMVDRIRREEGSKP